MGMNTGTSMGRKKRPALLRAKGRPMVRDAPPRGAPHHEAEHKPRKQSALILRSRAKRGVSKDEGPQAPALYRLMAWLSPAFPVGAFSYSSGIEWAVEAGDIKDADTLKAWLAVMLAEGGGYCDAVLFAHAHRAAEGADDKALHAVAELAAAFAPSKERHLETTAQGNAFVEAARAAWPCSAIDRLKAVWTGPVAYPVAVAVAAAGHGIALDAGARGLSAGRRRQLGLGRRAADPARAERRPARAGGAGARRRLDRAARAYRRARRHRLVGLPRRPRQRTARDAIHAAVSLLTLFL